MKIYNQEQLIKIRAAAKIVTKGLDYIESFINPGITGNMLDFLLEAFIEDHDAKPGNKGYRGYPKSICVSTNDRVCHGIPSDKALKRGDIVNIDFSVVKDGYYGDACRTFTVGNVSKYAKNLITCAKLCRDVGLMAVKPGALVASIGDNIQQISDSFGYSLVKEYGGHFIGDSLHEEPFIPLYGNNGALYVLEEGMVLCIEPMVNMGKAAIRTLNDQWTVVTKDHSLSAQFESQVIVTKDGYEVIAK